jgi:hypothetical protein
VLPTVISLVVLTTLIAGTVLAPRLLPRRIVLDEAPDGPRPFGRELSWLAIKTRDTSRVVEVLQLSDLSPANWNSGLGAVYDRELSDAFVFVSPPLHGWTIVAGVALPLPAGGSLIDKMSPLLQRLAARFSEAQYFATFPVIDFYAWARWEKGRKRRAFAIGEAGIVWADGRLTPDERNLGLSFIELRGIKDRQGDIGGALDLYPTERHVLGVAGAWSLNPLAVAASDADAGVGWIARVPQSWRAERRRRAA